MTQLTAHFSLAEMTRTEVRDADNTCPPALLPELLETAAMMERIRAALSADIGAPVRINVTSGYRSPIVNVRVGGSANSDHLDALAVDFRAPEYGTPYQVAHFLARHADDLQIGQVIHEFGSWVHVSRKRPAKEVNRIITVSRAGTRSGILEVA